MSRWRVALAATLALAGVGLVFAEPTLLGAAVVPLVYVAYGLFSQLSGEPQLRATRTFDPDQPAPGERVAVTLHVENVGDRVLPDLRVVDGVPDLAVVEGSPRAATALVPGETATLSYSVVARRGDHEFDEPRVRVRSLSAADVRTERLPVDAGTELTCGIPTRDPLAEAVLRRVEGLSPGGAGDGTEFYATREYRRGDPMRRIDWRHVAKTGEFVTVQYRDQQTARTAVVVDARGPGRVRPAPDYPSGAALAVDTAERMLTALDGRDVLAGLGVAGLDPDGPFATQGRVAWTDASPGAADPSTLLRAVRAAIGAAEPRDTGEGSGPGTAAGQGSVPARGSDADGGHTRPTRARPDGGPAGPGAGSATSGDDRSTTRSVGASGGHDGRAARSGRSSDGSAKSVGASDGSTRSIEWLLGEVPANTQVVLCTPALDDWAVEFGRAVTDGGHGLVVVSPDITGTGGVGPRLAGLDRQLRLQTLDDLGEVVDWTAGQGDETAAGEVV